MVKSSRPLLVAVVLAASLTGCRCNQPTTNTSRGEPRILVEAGGANVESAELDFGTVPMGKRVTATIYLSNALSGPLTVEAWEKVGAGPAVLLGTVQDGPSPVFGLEYEPQVQLSGGSTLEYTAFFEPPNELAAQVDHAVTLVLRTSNSTKDRVEITFKGRGIRGECDLPDRIDFGAVARGDTFAVAQTFKNPRPIESLPRVDPIMSTTGDAVFTLTPDSPRGEFSLAPGREKAVTIEFSPTEAREYFSTIKLRAADGCPEKTVRLLGTGVDQVLTWEPGTVSFGYVQPNVTVTQQITFSNRSFRDVVISNLATQEMNAPSVVYRVSEADQGNPTRLTVPKAVRDPATTEIKPGRATLTVAFKPVVLGPRPGAVVGTPDIPAQASISVTLRGFGGGPDIDLVSNAINFGRIAYFPTGTAFATRRATIRNVGTQPTPPDPAANLKLGAGGAGRPYWRVTPKNPQSLPSEICVGAFDPTAGCRNDLPGTGMGAYDPAVGIQAAGALAALDVPIRITPENTSVGPNGTKEWEVTFFSNDPDEPQISLTVTARPVVLPPCNYTIRPQSLAYGVVTPPSSKDQSFDVCNLAPASATNDICLLTNLDFEAGSDAMFTLPGTVDAEIELRPQECKTFTVRAWPQGTLPANPTNVTGAVAFTMSDPTRPQGRVQLTATLAPSCLVISPSALDFGTVKATCSTPSRTFQVYNACTQPIRWVGAELVSGAGVEPGTPGCPGPGRCNEFSVTTAPSTTNLPMCMQGGGSCLLQGGAPVTFQLKYRPLDLGPDTGAYKVTVVQSNQQVDYLVTLAGRGDNEGLNTDVFRQDTRPKADILVVVDDSCSMSDKQIELGRNFSSFIKFATTSQVDFQIGITTTTADDDSRCPNCISGDLQSSPQGTRIFTPSTPNLELQFAATVAVGTSGSPTEACMAPAVRALTAPKITDPAKNAGLLRPDAVLAVVCVTDAPDQSPQPVAYYLNQLINIKGAQRPGLFTYNVIGPFLPSAPSGCVYDGNGDDGRHIQMVSQSNGVREEICTPNWSTALENIGKNAFGFRTAFYLNGTPDLSAGPIVVQIDGVTQPEIAPPPRSDRIWTYEPASNAIVFKPLYVPEPGKTLTVTYRVACL